MQKICRKISAFCRNNVKLLITCYRIKNGSKDAAVQFQQYNFSRCVDDAAFGKVAAESGQLFVGQADVHMSSGISSSASTGRQLSSC